jgi:hypothetical protein
MKNFILIIIFISIENKIKSLCSMKQTCNVRDPKCLPSDANFTSPVPLYGPDVVCMEYLGKDACCNNGQNILLGKNFETISYIFGSDYGGCDICAVNLKRFWCEFTCSPNQDKFCKDFFNELIV